jgi:iron complex outermembrane receptor protein
MISATRTSARHAVVAALVGVSAIGASAQSSSSGSSSGSQTATDVRETVVVTGSVSPDALGSLGRTIVILTRQDLARLPVSTPIDALRLIPSVEVRERGPRGVQADFAIRGAGFGQALVLVNGARLNDAQSGHHNGDIPVSLLDVERIEVLLGGGASVHGADAVGGAINVITRRAGPRFAADLAVGQHSLIEAAAAVSLNAKPVEHVVSGEFNQSTGFAPHRDHDVKLARYQGALGQRTTLSVAYLDKEFGAAGFYGPAPSREWTDQTLVSAEHRFAPRGSSLLSIDGAYRSHGDRFVYDWTRPALSDNRHRTHAVSANGRWRTALGAATQLSVGASGGRDAIDSTGLGERTFTRAGAVVELRQAIGPRLVVQPGVRVDRYNRFGTAWSPAITASGWIVPNVRWRTATGRSFRIPTYTELYYQDPNHLASDDLVPERAWSADGGVDAFAGGWTASATAFGRWDADVIDWVRALPTERWRTTNIRDVDTRGVELGLSRRVSSGLLTLRYTGQHADAPTLALLSKYVLDYAPHALSVAGATTWRRLDLGSHVTYTRRADGRDYAVADLRVAYPFGRAEIYADVANAFDQAYQEVRGVDMPGRWLKVGLRLR